MSARLARGAHARIRATWILLVVNLVVIDAAWAAPRPYVTIHGSSSDPIVLRLIPELLSLGCLVRTVASDPVDPGSFTEGDAIVSVSETAVTFWLVDPQSGHASEVERFDIDDRGADAIPLTSLRVSEIVRAQLLHVEATGIPTRDRIPSAQASADAGPAQAAPDATSESGVADATRDAAPKARTPEMSAPNAHRTVRSTGDAGTWRRPPISVRDKTRPNEGPERERAAVAPSSPPHASVGVGPLLLASPGGMKPALELALSPEWHVTRRIQLRALLAAPLTSPTIVATGAAGVSMWIGGVATDWQSSSDDGNWRGLLGAGVAAILAHSQGSPNESYKASTASAFSGLPFVEIGGSRGLGSPRIRLAAAGMLGVALPDTVVQFAGRVVATWGVPVVGAVSALLDVDAW